MTPKTIAIICVLLNANILNAFSTVIAEPYMPGDVAEWETLCTIHPSCATVWNGLKVIELERNHSFDKACSVVTEKCQAQAVSGAFEILKEFTLCDGIVLCMGYINETAAEYEKQLIDGPWCVSNSHFCTQLKTRRTKRLAQGKAWCDEYHELCQHAIKLRVEVWGQYQQHLTRLGPTTAPKPTE